MDKEKIYSMAEETTIIKEILKVIGVEGKYGVEFGADDGYRFSNLRYFLNNGWDGLQMNAGNRDNPEVKDEFVTAENIELLLEKYKVPKDFDLLSIDIDGTDYWVWKAINKWKPKIVIIEYNPRFPVGEKKAIKYDPQYNGKGTLNYSASFSALKELGEQKGYRLIYENDYNNLTFVLEDVIPKNAVFPALSKTNNGNWETILPHIHTAFEENNYPFVEV